MKSPEPQIQNPVKEIPVGESRILGVGRLARGVREIVGGDVLQRLLSGRVVGALPVAHDLCANPPPKRGQKRVNLEESHTRRSGLLDHQLALCLTARVLQKKPASKLAETS